MLGCASGEMGCGVDEVWFVGRPGRVFSQVGLDGNRWGRGEGMCGWGEMWEGAMGFRIVHVGGQMAGSVCGATGRQGGA